MPVADGRGAAGAAGLRRAGRLARMEVALAGVAPGPLRASLALRGAERPHWRLRGQLEAIDPALFTGAERPAPAVVCDARRRWQRRPAS